MSSELVDGNHNCCQNPIEGIDSGNPSRQKLASGCSRRLRIAIGESNRDLGHDKAADGEENINTASAVVFPMKKMALSWRGIVLRRIDGVHPDDQQRGDRSQRLNRKQARIYVTRFAA